MCHQILKFENKILIRWSGTQLIVWLCVSNRFLQITCMLTRNTEPRSHWSVLSVHKLKRRQRNMNQLNDSISADDNAVLLVGLYYGPMPAGSKRLAGSPRWWEGELRYPWETVGVMGSPGSFVEEVKESLMSPLCVRKREVEKPTGEKETGEIHVERRKHITSFSTF